jgi:hypothetical protein
MPFALHGGVGTTVIEAQGVRHTINFSVDQLRQEPAIDHHAMALPSGKKGTRICIGWPDSARSILADAEPRFLQIADDFGWLNPICASRSDGTGSSASAGIRQTSRGKNGGLATRHLPIGTTRRGSSATSPPMSAGIGITVAIAPCAC